MRIHKGGHEIVTMEDWHKWAPPKKKDLHWKDDRSAKELARSWVGSPPPAPPGELRTLLEATFGSGIVFEEGKPECIIRLDEFKGEQRNCDLVILCTRESQRIVINIEAKADESFGDSTVGDYYDRTLKTKSNVPKRIKQISTALFGRQPDQGIRRLRYQLLHSAAAALIEAINQQADVAVFLVHEFHSPNLDPIKLEQNMSDWVAFVRAFPALATATVQKNQILGPISVPGYSPERKPIPLYLGHLVTEVQSKA
jgi:hypothetical protein